MPKTTAKPAKARKVAKDARYAPEDDFEPATAGEDLDGLDEGGFVHAGLVLSPSGSLMRSGGLGAGDSPFYD